MTIDGKSIAHSADHNGPNRITPTYYTWIHSIENYELDMPEKFNIGIDLEGEQGEQWGFSILVVKHMDVEIVTIDHKQQVEGLSLTASNLQIGPGGILQTYQAFSKNYDFLASFLRFRVVDS